MRAPGHAELFTMARPHSTAAYERQCSICGHRYQSTELAAQWTTAKGNARYWCPKCYRKGKLPPEGWRKVLASIETRVVRA